MKAHIFRMEKAKKLAFKELSPAEFITKFKEQFPIYSDQIRTLTKEELLELQYNWKKDPREVTTI